jgi:hypothetical protein
VKAVLVMGSPATLLSRLRSGKEATLPDKWAERIIYIRPDGRQVNFQWRGGLWKVTTRGVPAVTLRPKECRRGVLARWVD